MLEFKNNKQFFLIVVVLGLLILGEIGFLGYKFFIKKPGVSTFPHPTPEPTEFVSPSTIEHPVVGGTIKALNFPDNLILETVDGAEEVIELQENTIFTKVISQEETEEGVVSETENIPPEKIPSEVKVGDKVLVTLKDEKAIVVNVALPSTPFEEINFISGIFQRWKEIEDSSDKYVLFLDRQTGELFPKVRVGFELSPLFGDETGREDATVFAVEKSEEEYEVLGYLKDFASEEVDRLINQGDSIKIVLKKRMDKMENLKDENNNLLAHWLFIKRERGKEEVEEETGREIPNP